MVDHIAAEGLTRQRPRSKQESRQPQPLQSPSFLPLRTPRGSSTGSRSVKRQRTTSLQRSQRGRLAQHRNCWTHDAVLLKSHSSNARLIAISMHRLSTELSSADRFDASSGRRRIDSVRKCGLESFRDQRQLPDRAGPAVVVNCFVRRDSRTAGQTSAPRRRSAPKDA